MASSDVSVLYTNVWLWFSGHGQLGQCGLMQMTAPALMSSRSATPSIVMIDENLLKKIRKSLVWFNAFNFCETFDAA